MKIKIREWDDMVKEYGVSCDEFGVYIPLIEHIGI